MRQQILLPLILLASLLWRPAAPVAAAPLPSATLAAPSGWQAGDTPLTQEPTPPEERMGIILVTTVASIMIFGLGTLLIIYVLRRLE